MHFCRHIYERECLWEDFHDQSIGNQGKEFSQNSTMRLLVLTGITATSATRGWTAQQGSWLWCRGRLRTDLWNSLFLQKWYKVITESKHPNNLLINDKGKSLEQFAPTLKNSGTTELFREKVYYGDLWFFQEVQDGHKLEIQEPSTKSLAFLKKDVGKALRFRLISIMWLHAGLNRRPQFSGYCHRCNRRNLF